MIDKTTVGVTAEQEEVEAALRNLCGYHLAERDPLFRYTALTREQVLYDALVVAIKRERGRALAELAASGQKLTQIAQMTNLTSRQQVQRLITLSRAAEAAALEVQTASREFEDRLAAVEATLDEVVSGIAPATPGDGLDLGSAHVDGVASGVSASGSLGLAGEEPGSGDSSFFLEPTQFMPALRGVLQPTKEMRPTDDDVPWWRRGREAKDPGAA